MRKEWSAMKKLIWLKRAVLSAASTILKTITGLAPLLLGDALASPIHSLTQYGKCTQDGTPTPDAPVDIVTNNGVLKYSANMADVNEQTALVGYYISAQGAVLPDSYNWVYKLFIPCKPNTTYTLSMSQSVYFVSISEYSAPENSGFVIRKTGSTGTNTSLTITTGANTNFLRFGANVDRAPVPLEEVLGINWMLNLGGTAMDYQPYVEGGIYTDGTPEVLTVSGINLLDPSESNITIGELVSADGSFVVSLNNWRTDYIPIVGGKTYAFWGRKKEDNTISAYNRINWYTADKVNIAPRPSYTIKTVTIATAPSNAAYATLSCAPYNSSAAITRATFDLFDWMFAEAAQEIPYEPYVTPQTASVPMLWGVGGYKDTEELIGGLLTHKVGVWVLTGQESWELNSVYGTTDNAFLSRNAVPFKTNSKTLACTHFANKVNVETVGNVTVGVFAGSQISFFCGNRSEIDSVEKWKAYLAAQYAAGTPVIVLYPLATETTEQTTAQHLVTHEGTNIVDVASNVDPVELKAEYYATE